MANTVTSVVIVKSADLQEHIYDGGVHSFEFSSGVKLEVRHLRRDKYKGMCAEVDVYVEGEFIYNADFPISDQHKRIDFVAGASEQRSDVPWEACLIKIV